MGKPELVIAANPDSMAKQAAERTARVITESVQARGQCTLALAGGGTPKGVYALLAQMKTLPWDKVVFYYGDERCVAPDDKDSNHRMAHESLLGPLGIADAQIRRMEGEDADREQAAARYAASLPERFDLILLGMGPDGHTASLFPGHEAMGERQRLVMPVKGPKPPPWRLTLTAPVIEAAREVFVLAHGQGKAQKIAEVMGEPIDIAVRPIQLAHAGVWFLDEASASLLPVQ